jgi:glucans biosynthesis protein C
LEKKKERFVYIDNLRLLVIILVVMLHLGVTYSGFGSWSYTEGAKLDIFSTIVFGYSMSYTQGFFMGFLFLISGFFTPGAYDRKGFIRFLKDRFIRLGIPTLIFMLFVSPFKDYVVMDLDWITPKPEFLDYYWRYLSSFEFVSSTGPLWFALALLIFSCIYACIRLILQLIAQKSQQAEKPRLKEIRTIHVILLILLISVGAFCIRLIQPIDTSILNMQLCYFSQYIILFTVGIYAYRNNWFSSIPYQFGQKWFLTAMLGGIIPWTIIMVGGGALEGLYVYKGGMNWQSAAFALWESYISVSMAVGLITLFREKLNRQNKLFKTLSDNAFSVYLFHTPIIIYISLLLKEVTLPPLLKCLLLIVICIPVCFTISHFMIKRIPILNNVL